MDTNLNLEEILTLLNKTLRYTPWKTTIPDKVIISQSIKAFYEITKNKSKCKIIYRLCGQSGCGKTSQLLTSIQSALESQNKNPVVIAVREFVRYHPDYKKLIAKNDTSLIREITNGFALRCLFICTLLILENNYTIIYDVTLLTRKYENLFNKFLNFFHYNQMYNIITLHPDISNYFIQKRMNDIKSFEFGRKIKKSSKKFFNKTIVKNLKYNQKNYKNHLAIIWSIYNLKPIFIGKLNRCYKTYKKYRKIKLSFIFSEKELLKNKMIFYKQFLNKI